MKSMFTSGRKYLEGNDQIREKIGVVNAYLIKLADMRKQSFCPCCEQAIDKESVENDLTWFLDKKVSLEKEMAEKVEAERPAVEAEKIRREREKAKFKLDVEKFLENHKDEMLGVIRAEKGGRKVSLPKFDSKDSEELWNAGMFEIFKTRKDDILEYDEIQYG